MKKKHYEEPRLNVILLSHRQMILEGSEFSTTSTIPVVNRQADGTYGDPTEWTE